jgi:hypothetical protein
MKAISTIGVEGSPIYPEQKSLRGKKQVEATRSEACGHFAAETENGRVRRPVGNVIHNQVWCNAAHSSN